MDLYFNVYQLGKLCGIIIMMIGFIVLVYLLVIQTSDIFLWEIGTAFWFGSSLFWESSYYEKMID